MDSECDRAPIEIPFPNPDPTPRPLRLDWQIQTNELNAVGRGMVGTKAGAQCAPYEL